MTVMTPKIMKYRRFELYLNEQKMEKKIQKFWQVDQEMNLVTHKPY